MNRDVQPSHVYLIDNSDKKKDNAGATKKNLVRTCRLSDLLSLAL